MSEYLQVLAFWTPGPLEMVIILIVAVLIFGRRLPEIARGLGKSISEFKKGVKEVKDTGDEIVQDVNRVGGDVVNEVKDAVSDDDRRDEI